MCSTMAWLLVVVLVAMGWLGCGLVAALYFGRRGHVSSRETWRYLRTVALLWPLGVWVVWDEEG